MRKPLFYHFRPPILASRIRWRVLFATCSSRNQSNSCAVWTKWILKSLFDADWLLFCFVCFSLCYCYTTFYHYFSEYHGKRRAIETSVFENIAPHFKKHSASLFCFCCICFFPKALVAKSSLQWVAFFYISLCHVHRFWPGLSNTSCFEFWCLRCC